MIMLLFLISFSGLPDPPAANLIRSRVERNSGKFPEAAFERLPVRRQRAWLLTLGQNGDPRGRQKLVAAFAQKSLQRTAFFAYGEIDGAPLAPLLAIAGRVAPEHHSVWAEAVAKLAGKQDGQAVFKLWQSFEETAKNQSLYYFWRVVPDALTQAVKDQLRTRNSDAEEGYVYYLYRSRTVVPPALLSIILDDFRNHSQSLIHATRIQTSTSQPRLEAQLTDLCRHADWRLRINGLNALSVHHKNGAVSQAMIMIGDSNPNVVRNAIGHLTQAASPRIDRFLEAAAKNFSPSQLQTLIGGMEAERAMALWERVASWRESDSSWKRQKAIQFPGSFQTPGGQRFLIEQLERQGDGEAVLALNALIQNKAEGLKKRILTALHGGDVYLMAAAAAYLGDSKNEIDYPPYLFRKLAMKTYEEPDFHYAYMDAIKALQSEQEYAQTLEELRTHADYAVRLKALELTEKAGLSDRVAVLERGWQTGIPRKIIDDAAQLLELTSGTVFWQLETAKGRVKIRLKTAYAPITCANIMFLSRKGYFNDMALHRVVANFVVQGGDRRGDGAGGPGYAIPCEINMLRYKRGSVGMALSGKDTGGSQFFVCHSDQPHLDGGYTIFGEVIAGMEIIDRLEEGDLILKTTITAP